MKVSYGGRVRKINQIPNSMSEFKRIVQQRFINCKVNGPDQDQTEELSRMLNDTDAVGNNGELASMIDQSIASRAEESKAGRGSKKQKTIIDFSQSITFYEDSEGDLNVISEDEDLQDATTYVVQHQSKSLKCSIVPKTFYEDLRNE